MYIKTKIIIYIRLCCRKVKSGLTPVLRVIQSLMIAFLIASYRDKRNCFKEYQPLTNVSNSFVVFVIVKGIL